MTVSILVGLFLLVVGVFLIGFGMRATQTFTNRVVEGVTGRYPRRTMWILLGGGFLVLIGLGLIYMGWQEGTLLIPPRP